MTGKTIVRVFVVTMTLVLLGWGGYSVAGNGPEGGLLSKIGQRLHGHHAAGGHQGGHASHMHAAMASVIDALALRADQQQQVERIHVLFQTQLSPVIQGHDAHLQALADAVEARSLTPADVRVQVDHHVELFRQLAYDVGDEVVALFDSFDADQRATMAAHFRALADRHGGGGDQCQLEGRRGH